MQPRYGPDGSAIKIIPVNITVGASGSVLVTLKSDRSQSPYVILNRCRDIVINMRQKAPVEEDEMDQKDYLERVGWDVFYPDPLRQLRPVPFAWDEPNKPNVLQVLR